MDKNKKANLPEPEVKVEEPKAEPKQVPCPDCKGEWATCTRCGDTGWVLDSSL